MAQRAHAHITEVDAMHPSMISHPDAVTDGARLYWENNANNLNAVDVSIPRRGDGVPR
jgi:hypothetical protein